MTAPTAVPVPLPPGARQLRAHRYVASIMGERFTLPDGHGARRRELARPGRFVTLADAKAWADATHPDAPCVFVDRWAPTSPLRGAPWHSTRVAERVGTEWQDETR